MKLCVALDLSEKEQNLSLVKALKGSDVWMKVGLRSYIRDGASFIEEIKQIDPNFKIFLDLKIHDIPNTMADAAEVMAGLHVDMFNVHASAGYKAMKMVMDRLKGVKNRPLVLSVTALTSFDEAEFQRVYHRGIDVKANEFAKDSYAAEVDGVVCSVYESKRIKSITSDDFITLTPGIRAQGEATNDQSRVATVEVAKENLSDFIVVGRPIYTSSDPKGVVENILTKL